MTWVDTRTLVQEEAKTGEGNSRKLTPMTFLVPVILTIQIQEEESLSLMILTVLVLVLGGQESEGMESLRIHLEPIMHTHILCSKILMMCSRSFSGGLIHLLTSSTHLEEEEDY